MADKHFMDDRESLDALIQQMPADDLQDYQEFKSLTMDSAFPGRKFVVYDIVGGKPTNVELLTFGAMRMSERVGPSVEVTSSNLTKGVVAVGMVPVKVPGRQLFLHLPQRFEFKWKARALKSGEGVNFAPHYAVLIKTRNRPAMQVDGDTYCVRLNQFRELYPAHPVRY